MKTKVPIMFWVAVIAWLISIACQAQQTNLIYGTVGNYGLTPQNRVSVTLTLVSPNPRTINNIPIRQDPISTLTDTNGYFAFTNVQWGNYTYALSGAAGTTFKLAIYTNDSGSIPIASRTTTATVTMPNPATNFYTMSQINALLANISAGYIVAGTNVVIYTNAQNQLVINSTATGGGGSVAITNFSGDVGAVTGSGGSFGIGTNQNTAAFTNIVNGMRPASQWTTNQPNVQLNGGMLTNLNAAQLVGVAPTSSVPQNFQLSGFTSGALSNNVLSASGTNTVNTLALAKAIAVSNNIATSGTAYRALSAATVDNGVTNGQANVSFSGITNTANAYYNSFGVKSIGVYSLYNNNGHNTVDWSTGRTRRDDNSTSIDWQNSILYTAGYTSINWANRTLDNETETPIAWWTNGVFKASILADPTGQLPPATAIVTNGGYLLTDPWTATDPVELINVSDSPLGLTIYPLISPRFGFSAGLKITTGFFDSPVFIGGGFGLTNIPSSAISNLASTVGSQIAGSNYVTAATSPTNGFIYALDATNAARAVVGQSNLVTQTTLTTASNAIVAQIPSTATLLATNGNGSGLTSLNASQLTSGTIPAAVRISPSSITNDGTQFAGGTITKGVTNSTAGMTRGAIFEDANTNRFVSRDGQIFTNIGQASLQFVAATNGANVAAAQITGATWLATNGSAQFLTGLPTIPSGLVTNNAATDITITNASGLIGRISATASNFVFSTEAATGTNSFMCGTNRVSIAIGNQRVLVVSNDYTASLSSNLTASGYAMNNGTNFSIGSTGNGIIFGMTGTNSFLAGTAFCAPNRPDGSTSLRFPQSSDWIDFYQNSSYSKLRISAATLQLCAGSGIVVSKGGGADLTSAGGDGTAGTKFLAIQIGTWSVTTNMTVQGTVAATNGFASYSSNTLAPTSISFPATTVNWTNTTALSGGKNIFLMIDNTGVTVTAIKKNGAQIFQGGNVTIPLQPNEYFSETYSAGSPTATWCPY